MVASEAVLHVLHGPVPGLASKDLSSSFSDLILPCNLYGKPYRRGAFKRRHIFKCSSVLNAPAGLNRHRRVAASLCGVTALGRMQPFSCKCQQSESVGGVSTEGANGAWYVDGAQKLNLNGADTEHGFVDFQDIQQLEKENDLLNSNGSSGVGTGATCRKAVSDSIEEEAWNLLRNSVVHYCGSPIGTIAANDPTGSSVLNYDQVFIRDFISSGVAFLLHGEYDIVRNFILYTLQLQVN